MRKTIIALALLHLTILLSAQRSVNITYTANDGFLISGKSGNVLIDALLRNPLRHIASKIGRKPKKALSY
jgi:hypothetical protein